MRATDRLDAIGIADVVGSGKVVAAAPGDGPDSAVLLVWDEDDQSTFRTWETWDGTTWTLTGEALGETPIANVGQAAHIGNQVLRWLRQQSDEETPSGMPSMIVVHSTAGPEVEC